MGLLLVAACLCMLQARVQTALHRLSEQPGGRHVQLRQGMRIIMTRSAFLGKWGSYIGATEQCT